MSPAPATATARHRRTSRTTQRPPVLASRDGERAASLRRSPVPRAPRRVSGPARPLAVPRPAVRGALRERLGVWVRNLPDHRLLDRLIRGRTWIVLIGVLLAGIVAVQVSMLRMNAGISRSVEQAQLLQRSNQQMEADVASLGSDSRLAALAERQGFHTPTAGSERYLSAGAGDARRAARDMKPPQPHQTTTVSPTAATTTTPTATGTGGATGTTTTATPSGSSTTSSTTTGATGAGTSGGATGTGTAQSTTGTTGTGTPIAAPTSGTAGNSTGGASGG
jgi:hypothetical protein